MVHGDLNKGNILWWVDENRPLLIDFATFCEESHTLQDFANLEAQVRFALMDREDDSKLTALDFADEQLKHWKERQTFLVPSYPAGMRAFSESESRNQKHRGCKRADELTSLIRREAFSVHTAAVRRSNVSNLATPQRFDDEYAAALLFPTLRAIGYGDSLSPFKRLLAVHSAARLISRLNALASIDSSIC
jgi:hypothetical protein